MNTEIYVFTGTGNALHIAKTIQSGLNDCTIHSIPKMMKQNTFKTTSQRVGFIFPCYYGSMPQMVKSFLKQLDISSATYTFGIATAGREQGYGLRILETLLADKGKQLNYATSVNIASNYMVGWYYSAVLPEEAQITKNLETANQTLQKVIKDLSNHVTYIEKSKWINFMVPQLISPTKVVKDTRSWDQEFSMGDECTNCGLCAKVCPVDNIQMKDGKPVFSHDCQRCMACIQYCPSQAIYYKEKRMNKRRYHHPKVNASELTEFHKA